jgi:hypothetical protein
LLVICAGLLGFDLLQAVSSSPAGRKDFSRYSFSWNQRLSSYQMIAAKHLFGAKQLYDPALRMSTKVREGAGIGSLGHMLQNRER